MSNIKERTQKTVYFDNEDISFIEKEAKMTDRSFTSMLRIIIKDYKNDTSTGKKVMDKD